MVEAEAAYRKAVEISGKSSTRCPMSRGITTWRSIVGRKLGDFLRDSRRDAEAHDVYVEALRRSRVYASKFPDSKGLEIERPACPTAWRGLLCTSGKPSVRDPAEALRLGHTGRHAVPRERELPETPWGWPNM